MMRARMWAGLLTLGVATPAALGQGFGGVQRIEGIGPCVTTAFPPGERNRLFVLEIHGRVRLIENGVLQTTPFLDFAATAGAGNGATGLAFDPDFANNGYFYIVHTARSVPPAPFGLTLVRYKVSESNPNLADPASRTPLLVTDSLGEHTGGWVDFAPDGLLYMSTGDNHNADNGQNRTNLAGKILRLNVHADDFPDDPVRNYAIPPGNPFAGPGDPGADEIWAIGLRNPFRCSFDRLTGDFWIADVGESRAEEINRSPYTTAGLNYGWPCYEGAAVRTTDGVCASLHDATFPLVHLPRSVSSCVIGGFVYRGCANPGMVGRYVFGTCSTGVVRSIDPARPATSLITHTSQLSGLTGLYGFGEDADGELYFCSFAGLFKLLPPTEGAYTDCNANGRADACEIADGSAPDENNDGLPDTCTRLCPADFDASGAVTVNDLFFFLHRYFQGALSADLNASGGLDPGDLFTFLRTYFVGC